MLKWLLFDHFPSQRKGKKRIATLFQCRGRCDSTRLLMFITQPCHAPMFSDRAVEGRRFWFGVPGYRGRAPSGFWVLLGGPKVPPRAAVLRKRTGRRTGTRIAIMVRKAKQQQESAFQPHLSFQRKAGLKKTDDILVFFVLYTDQSHPPHFTSQEFHLCHFLFLIFFSPR